MFPALLLALVAGAVLAYLLLGRSGTEGGATSPWQRHLAAQGLRSAGGPAHVPGRADLRLALLVRVEGFDQPMFLEWYHSPAAAQRQLAESLRHPENAASAARGAYLLRLPHWPPDAPLTRKVRAAFDSFDVDAAGA